MSASVDSGPPGSAFSPGADAAPPPGWVVALLTAVAYGAVGWVALMLAGPPGYASPLYPPAGIALAAAAVYGRAALPGVALGAFGVNLMLGALREPGVAPTLWLPLLIALGAALQAGAGAWLVQRCVAQPLSLTAPRDILVTGLLGGVVACVISPSIATAALVAAGTLAPAQAGANWSTWWLGDTLGVLIGAPVALTLIGRPREDWAPRRLSVALPSLVALALLALALTAVSWWEQERREARFERDAERLGAVVQARLAAPLHALQALHSAALVRGALDSAALRNAAHWWLQQPLQLQAMGYSVVVPRAQAAPLEAEARTDGLPGFRVFEREDGALSADDSMLLVLRQIEPREGNDVALGVNTLSIAAARAAVLAARDSAEPAATGGFRLTQSLSDETGMVVYQALYRGSAEPSTVAERIAHWSGVVFVTLRVERMLGDLPLSDAGYLRWCLLDTSPGATRPVLAAHAQALQHGACTLPDASEAVRTDTHLGAQRTLPFGGRDLVLRVGALHAEVPGESTYTAWLLSTSGLAATALLGSLLLVVTGHTRRTERAVAGATEALRQEMAQRSQAQQALAEGEARLRAIVDSAPMGVAFMDPQGRYLRVNSRLEAMLGVAPGGLLGQHLADRAHPEDLPALRRGHREVCTRVVDLAQQQLRLVRADGACMWVRVTASVLRDAQGRVVHMVALLEDITERLRLEASERALHRAEAASQAKSEFVSRMSHELRTPLNAMLGFAQLLSLDREPALTNQQQDWAQHIQRAGWHLLEMINETLDLARIEAGAVQLAQAPVPVAPLLAECRAMLADAAARRRVRMEEQLSPQAPAVLGDPTRVRQVLINLLSNAVKYNREGGSLTVHTRLGADGLVELAVQDTGLGMSETQLSALFEPYNRLGREDSGVEGTGLGLVISRRLAELMGGSLEVASRAGQGSTFTLRLPLAALPDAVAAAQLPSPAEYHRRRVHYVEDNETNVEVMRGVLAQRPQIELAATGMGLDAMAALRAQRPDLILLDMHLPDISGLELLRHLKRDEALAEVPVIVVSADATPERRREALLAGALHYVTKPVDVPRFLDMLDHVLQQLETRFG
jgi:PAS domain S-box-containing protein